MPVLNAPEVHCRTQPPLLPQTALYGTCCAMLGNMAAHTNRPYEPCLSVTVSHWMTRGLQCMHPCVVHSGSHASHTRYNVYSQCEQYMRGSYTHHYTNSLTAGTLVKPHHEQYTRGSCTSQAHNLPTHTSCCTVGYASEQALFMVFMTSASALGQTAVGEHCHQVVVITGCSYLSLMPLTG